MPYMVQKYSKMKKLFNLPVLFLILSNLYPIYAVYNNEITAFSVVVLYILETLIVTFYTILKAKKLKNDGFSKHDPLWLFILAYAVMTFATLGFFLVFIGIYLSQAENPISVWSFFNASLWNGLLLLLFSHGVSYYFNYILKKEYLHTTFDNLFSTPYQRVVAQQITIIVGGVVLGIVNGAFAFMAVLIIVKITLDIKAHIKSHKIISSIV